MKHVTALIIKFVMIATLLVIVLGMATDLTVTEILYISAAVTALAYVINVPMKSKKDGDLWFRKL